MSTGKRIVLLTGTGPQHLCVARDLAATGLLTAVVHDLGVVRSRKNRMLSAGKRFGVPRLAQRLALRAALRASGEAARRTQEIVRLLGHPRIPEDLPQHQVRGVNTPATRALLGTLDIDILCVYGTNVVHDETLALAGDIALNLHTGISPYYRGSDCAFWPLHDAQPHMLGATVHQCTSAIDGGAIFGTRRASVEAGDGVGAVFARCVLAGAAMYAQVLRDVVAGESSPVPQDPAMGREFRAAMRGWRAERQVQRLLRDGLIRDYVHDGQPAEWSA